MNRVRLPLEYVLPLRWSDDTELAELTAYLRRLRRQAAARGAQVHHEAAQERHRNR